MYASISWFRCTAMAAVATAAIAVGGIQPAAAGAEFAAPDEIPLTIINNSGKKQALYVYIKGVLDGKAVYVANKKGNLKYFPPTVTPKPFAINLGTNKRTKLKLPQIQGARIYVSFAKPIVVPVGNNGFPGEPNGWASDFPNYKTLFDWIEYTWNPEGPGKSTLGANTTQVDMFGFPMNMKISGFEPDYTTPVVMSSGFPRNANNVRDKIIDAISDAGRPWKRLIVRPNNPRRVIAPNHGIEVGKFPEHQFDGYIEKVFDQYHHQDMTAVLENIPYVGRVTAGDVLRFERKNDPSVSFTIPKPTTLVAYAGNLDAVPVPTDPAVARQAGAVKPLLQGSLMRTTLLVQPDLDACKRKQFYKNNPVNIYASAIHDQGIKKLAYAFGFDDSCDQSSVIIPKNPKWMKITVLPM